MKDFFAHQPGVSQALDLMPVVTGRFVSLNGKPLDQLKGQHFPRRMLESAELSWADAPPEGDKVTQGKWWTTATRSEIAVGEGVGRAAASGRWLGGRARSRRNVRKLKVAAIYRADGQHLGARVRSCCLRGCSRTSRPPGTAARTSIRNRWRRWSARSFWPIPRSP